MLTNKYAEGYPAKRYYGGCEFVDRAEELALERAKKLFGAAHANVQPHSGSSANLIAYFALLEPGDTILGMNLAHGGHLTHGHDVNFSGRFFSFSHYGVTAETGRIDYDALEKQAREVQAQDDRRRRERLPARARLSAPALDRRRGGGGPPGRHGPHLGSGRRRRASEPGPARAHRHLDHAQDPARAALRVHPLRPRSTPRPSTRPSSRGCRAARSCT